MPVKKPEGLMDDFKAAVKEGKTFKEVTEELQSKYGEKEGTVGVSTYGKLRKLAFPEGKLSEVVGEIQEGRRSQEKKKHPLPQWSPQKQAAGDKSQLAKVLNDVLFYVIPCKTGELKLEHIQEINVGGGVVNTIQYAFPSIDLSNPILVLALRVGLLIVKVKKLCSDIKGKIRTGVKPGFQNTSGVRNEEPEIPPIISMHPLDQPEMKALWQVKEGDKDQ